MTDSSVTGRNQNHSDIRDESARDNDPLFELSRIFGFEEPVAQTNTPVSQPETEVSSEFSLERELMAGFDAEFANEFAGEPQLTDNDYQPVAYDEPRFEQEPIAAQPVYQEMPEPQEPQRVIEPHFTGYAPMQRAYAEPKPVEEPAPVFEQEEHFYYQQDESSTAPEAVYASDIQPDADYASVTQPVADYASTHQDYYASLENELNQTFADEVAVEPVQAEQFFAGQGDTDFGFETIGQEPHQAFGTETLDQDYAPVVEPVSPAAVASELSFEDELSFLLGGENPAPSAQQPEYSAPVYAQTPAYDEGVAAEPVYEQEFEPLFDAPAADFAPAEDVYSNTAAEPVQHFEQIDDEFFAAPDLTHLPNRTASAYVEPEDTVAEQTAEPEPAHYSFEELFSATSNPAHEEEPVAENFALDEVQQLADFNIDDDFYASDIRNSVAEPVSTPAEIAPIAPLAANAVRGYSSYKFGASTPAPHDTQNVSTTEPVKSERALDAVFGQAGAYAQTASFAEPVSEPATAFEEDFFSNDDFNFSFDEDVQPAAAVANYEETTFEAQAYEPVADDFPPAFTASSVPAPEVEAIAVSENKVDQTLSLDLPEVSYGDEPKDTGLNSLETEFAEIFSTISVNETALPETTSEADKAFENILQDSFADYQASSQTESVAANRQDGPSGLDIAGSAVAGLAAAAAGNAAARNRPAAADGGKATQDDYFNHWAAQGAQANDFDNFNLAENFARDNDGFEQSREESAPRKTALWAGVAAAALIVLGGGYYLLKSGGIVGGDPVVLQAETQPVKMQPENPGGTVVPNQDKAVYDQVAGTAPSVPEQTTLINTEEQPVDLGLLQGQDAEEDRLLGADDEEIAAAAPEAQEGLIAPRTVKTMVVRADGTIVPSETPAAKPATPSADNGLDEANSLLAQSAVPERLGGDQVAHAAQNTAAPRVVQTQSFTASGEQVKPREVTTAPVVPTRPAEVAPAQTAPVERPAETQPVQQVASANVPAGTWYIQVASQPSAELAQKNYTNLTSRYGNLLGGRGVDIKKADIPGKGTYYRVRIPAGTKAEAGALCERLKAAGGSCFPTL